MEWDYFLLAIDQLVRKKNPKSQNVSALSQSEWQCWVYLIKKGQVHEARHYSLVI